MSLKPLPKLRVAGATLFTPFMATVLVGGAALGLFELMGAGAACFHGERRFE